MALRFTFSRLKSRAVAVAFAAAVITCISASPKVIAQTSPSTWDQVAKGEPITFATALVTASVPVGAELSVVDMRPSVRPNGAQLAARTPDLGVLIQTFNETHADYVAAIVGKAIVIRPTIGRLAYLDGPLNISPPVTTGAMLALKRVFAPIRPSLGGEAIVGSSRVDAVEAGDFLTITFSAGSKVVEALNDLAVQASAGWVVATGRDAHGTRVLAEIGLIHKDGVLSSFKLVPQKERAALSK